MALLGPGEGHKMVQSPWKIVEHICIKLNLHLPYDPAVPSLGIYLIKTDVHTKSHAQMLIAPLSIITQNWKSPSTDE